MRVPGTEDMYASERRRWILASWVERAARSGAIEAGMLAMLVLSIFAGAMRAAM